MLSKKQLEALILQGKIYASVRVSSSRMTRFMKFYFVKKNRIINITPDFAFHSGKTLTMRDEIKTSTTGMDAVFGFLYYFLSEEKKSKWNQKYREIP